MRNLLTCILGLFLVSCGPPDSKLSETTLETQIVQCDQDNHDCDKNDDNDREHHRRHGCRHGHRHTCQHRSNGTVCLLRQNGVETTDCSSANQDNEREACNGTCQMERCVPTPPPDAGSPDCHTGMGGSGGSGGVGGSGGSGGDNGSGGIGGSGGVGGSGGSGGAGGGGMGGSGGSSGCEQNGCGACPERCVDNNSCVEGVWTCGCTCGSGGTGGNGGEAGSGGNGGEAGTGGSGGVGPGGSGGQGGVGGSGGSGPEGAPYKDSDTNRVGWGCSAAPNGDNSTNALALLGLIGLAYLAFKYVGKRTLLVVLPLIALTATSVRADEKKLHLELDAVWQPTPEDHDGLGNHNERLGGMISGAYSLSAPIDVGVGVLIGRWPGLRFFGDFHTDRSAHRFNPFVRPEVILHPAGGNAGLGLGALMGVTIEAGPGRVVAGPAVEMFTAPDKGGFRNFDVLLVAGYQFDFTTKRDVAPVVEAPRCERPKKPIKVIQGPIVPVPTPRSPTISEYRIDAKVLFDFDKSVLKPEGKVLLSRFAQLVKEHKDDIVKIVVEGHTCSIGTDAYNQALSERRANAVLEFLVELGIDRGSLSAVGYGESKPAESNDTKAGRAANRRVELVVTVKE